MRNRVLNTMKHWCGVDLATLLFTPLTTTLTSCHSERLATPSEELVTPNKHTPEDETPLDPNASGIEVVFETNGLRAGTDPIIGGKDSDKPIRTTYEKFYTIQKLYQKNYSLYSDLLVNKNYYLKSIKYRIYDVDNPRKNLDEQTIDYRYLQLLDGSQPLKNIGLRIPIPKSFVPKKSHYKVVISAEGGDFSDPKVDKTDFCPYQFRADLPYTPVKSLYQFLLDEQEVIGKLVTSNMYKDFDDDYEKLTMFCNMVALGNYGRKDDWHSKVRDQFYEDVLLYFGVDGSGEGIEDFFDVSVPHYKAKFDELIQKERANFYDRYKTPWIAKFPEFDRFVSAEDYGLAMALYDCFKGGPEENDPELIIKLQKIRVHLFILLTIDVMKKNYRLYPELQNFRAEGKMRSVLYFAWDPFTYFPFAPGAGGATVARQQRTTAIIERWDNVNKDLMEFREAAIAMYNRLNALLPNDRKMTWHLTKEGKNFFNPQSSYIKVKYIDDDFIENADEWAKQFIPQLSTPWGL